MAKVNQLKNQARREEQRENWSRAIELYTQALDASRRESEGFADLSLYNRIGDIYLRIGQKNTAVRYYEQAIELYAEQDLHTSAIALCNKVLRILPDRSTVFLQLGRLNLATNLVAESREHYHRYAAAMRKRGSEEAALEGLEELIAATGDVRTLTVWAGWLAEASDVERALTRIEKLREPLERHGVDPDEVAGQVRSKAVVGFEGKGGEAPAADPLAGAFLTLGDESPARGDGPAATPEFDDTLEGERPDAFEVQPAGVDRGLEDPDGQEAADLEPEPREESDGLAEEEADASDEPSEPAPVEPGSIPWEQEVEELIAEFDVALEDSWGEVSPEPEDLAVEPGGVARPRPDPEASEAGTTWAHPAARSPRTVEAAEYDEGEPAVARAAFAGAIDVEDDEDPSVASGPIEDDRVAREGAETRVEDDDAPWPEPVDGEGPESIVAGGPERGPAGDVDEEPAEGSSGVAGEPLEAGFTGDADDLESIVQSAAALGESAGFDAEPSVVADELPEPEPEEPSEPDVESPPLTVPDASVVPSEPSDPVAPEPEDDATFELEGPVESLATADGPAADSESPATEGDERLEGDDPAWIEEARHALDARAAVTESAEAEEVELEAETIAVEWTPGVPEPAAGTAEPAPRADATEPAPERPANLDIAAPEPAVSEQPTEPVEPEPAPESAVDDTVAAEPDSAVDDTVAAESESVADGMASADPDPDPEPTPTFEPAPPVGAAPVAEGVEAGAGPANGRQGSRAGKGAASDEDEDRAPLAEPRLQVGEDPEDAFSDWVESASTGVLKRALSELANRKEHDRALAVIRRLTELEETDVDLRIRHVEYLESLARIPEAVDACLAMAGMLEAEGRVTEARDAYERTKRLAPGEERALEGLARLEGVEEDSQGEAVQGIGPKRPYMPDHVNGADRGSVIDRPMPSASAPVEGPGLGPRPYSGVAGGSEAGSDFEQLLSEFRAELNDKPGRSDSSSRTELGARLKEMGRLDDAIRELQAAVREPSAPPLAFELLGEAFLEKGQPRIAVRFLEKALGSLSQGDREILGVLYQLGIAYESLSDASRALICYERIFSVDIDYRDIQERILSCSA